MDLGLSYVLFLIFFLFILFLKSKETFLNVVEAQQVYNNYRSYIDENYKLKKENGFIYKRRPPFISGNCVIDKFPKCGYEAFNICSVPIIN